MTIIMPMPMNLGNGSHGHWSSLYGKKKRYWSDLDMRQLTKQIPLAPHSAFNFVRVSSVMYLGARMDYDGAMRRHKWPMDWLTTRGYIVDDSPKHVEWTGFPQQIIKRGQFYRIELTLEPYP